MIQIFFGPVTLMEAAPLLEQTADDHGFADSR
eukprot:CAMPEP_0196741824 /NCGR_PEP_ID=MMETSP1091-20130531/42971_1 /TAXON_ID=302021 /ORGANISM="Rhodomonas sp., Strain CCMP768" /LENGTH=31 /DNA_ID= /DNA_START= /DNA_END= /DNA_ORIENTATION=